MEVSKDTQKVIPKHITQAFNLQIKESDLDFFDANLAHDSRLFIDPSLIKNSPFKEERELYGRFGIFFKIALEKSIKVKNDIGELENLSRFLSFREPKEIYLGYTETSNDGSGLASYFATALFQYLIEGAATKTILNEEIYNNHEIDPKVLSIFADKIADDGISDLAANLIMDFLIEYTQKQCKNLKIDCKPLPVSQTFDFESLEWSNGINALLPENPLMPGKPIVFVPKRFLRSGEYAVYNEVKSKVVGILRSDPDLTRKFSNTISKSLSDISLNEIRMALLSDETILKKYIEEISKDPHVSYDFNKDILNFYAFKKFEKYFDNNPVLNEPNSSEDLLSISEDLIKCIKEHFENKDGWKDVWGYNKKGTYGPKSEVSWGRIIRGMGDAYFLRYPNIKFIPEPGSGNGPADFIVIYKNFCIVIEIKKLCSSSQKGKPPLPAYIHGIKRQLPAYTSNFKAQHSIYLTGQHFHKNGKKENCIDYDLRIVEINNLIKEVEENLKSLNFGFKSLKYINIDLTPKGSASNC